MRADSPALHLTLWRVLTKQVDRPLSSSGEVLSSDAAVYRECPGDAARNTYLHVTRNGQGAPERGDGGAQIGEDAVDVCAKGAGHARILLHHECGRCRTGRVVHDFEGRGEPLNLSLCSKVLWVMDQRELAARVRGRQRVAKRATCCQRKQAACGSSGVVRTRVAGGELVYLE
eukprot:951249-Prymnesium_polylepis.2